MGKNAQSSTNNRGVARTGGGSKSAPHSPMGLRFPQAAQLGRSLWALLMAAAVGSARPALEMLGPLFHERGTGISPPKRKLRHGVGACSTAAHHPAVPKPPPLSPEHPPASAPAPRAAAGNTVPCYRKRSGTEPGLSRSPRQGLSPQGGARPAGTPPRGQPRLGPPSPGAAGEGGGPVPKRRGRGQGAAVGPGAPCQRAGPGRP